MKKTIFILYLLFISLVNMSAQDVIICRNGDEMISKVLKISSSEVEYKKWSNQDGPTYTISKSEVFMIKYKNGEKDVFKETPAQTMPEQVQTSVPQEPEEPVLAAPAANNAELIAQYNNEVHEYVPENPNKNNDKPAKSFIGTLGITSSSILSTDDIEISLLPIQEAIGDKALFSTGIKIGKVYSGINENWLGDIIKINSSFSAHVKYAIIIKNKTSRPIYIDKAACLGKSSTGNAKTYFDPQEFTITEGGNSGTGANVNLGSVANALGIGGVVGTLAGGVNVGGNNGKFSTVTRTYKNERVLKIPPKSSLALSEDSHESYPIEKYALIVLGAYEYFGMPNLSLNIDEKVKFAENNTPKKIDYTITYSSDKDFAKSFVVNFGVYLKDAFGIKVNMRRGIIKSFNNRVKLSHNTLVVIKSEVD